MKAVFISYNQAYNEEIVEILESLGQRGFTRWNEVDGKGGFNGIPHFGSHAWPEQNNVILTMIPDEKVERLLEAVRRKDKQAPDLGLRAFVWNIETFY